jgi:hypothetical protein
MDKIARAFEKNSIWSQKTVKKTRFSSIFWTFKLRALLSPPRITKTRGTKLFAIMKGNFSALAVKQIREKSKNDPPYSGSSFCSLLVLGFPLNDHASFLQT